MKTASVLFAIDDYVKEESAPPDLQLKTESVMNHRPADSSEESGVL